jgi:hypothetical protein
MFSSHGGFVVKLPKDRVDALVTADCGSRFEPSSGREMKQWLTVNPVARADWLALAKETMDFIGGADRS